MFLFMEILEPIISDFIATWVLVAIRYSLRIKRRPEALGHQKLSWASKFSFWASKFFFFFMFKNL